MSQDEAWQGRGFPEEGAGRPGLAQLRGGKKELKALEDDPERPLPQKILHHLEEAVVGVRGATKETPADFLSVGVR